MKKMFMSMLIALSGLCAMLPAWSVERGTADDAIALVKKAEAYLKANGKEKAFAEISNTSGQFVKGDVYVFVHDLNGVCVAHGGNPKLVGKNLKDLKDATGFFMVQKFIEVANGKGKGWVDYKWPNKATNEVENKSTYLEKVGDLIITAGIYK